MQFYTVLLLGRHMWQKPIDRCGYWFGWLIYVAYSFFIINIAEYRAEIEFWGSYQSWFSKNSENGILIDNQFDLVMLYLIFMEFNQYLLKRE